MDERQKKIFHNGMKALYVLQEEEGYNYRSHIWTGGFGSVFTMIDSQTRKTVVVKCTVPDHTGLVELDYWKYFNHPNVLPLLGTYVFNCTCVFIMPLLRTDLFAISDDISFYKDPMSYDLCRFWFRDTMRGLCYLHDIELAHSDLKLDNIFIKDDGHACVADFSLSGGIFGRIMKNSKFVSLLQPPECTTFFNKRFFVGSEEEYPLASDDIDMWQFGILVMDMLTKKKLTVEKHSSDSDWEYDIFPIVLKFVHDRRCWERYLRTMFPNQNFEENDVEICHGFLQKILRILPNQRMNSRDAYNHAFLSVDFPQRPRPKGGTPGLLIQDYTRSRVAESFDAIGDKSEVEEALLNGGIFPDYAPNPGREGRPERRERPYVEFVERRVLRGRFKKAVLEPLGTAGDR